MSGTVSTLSSTNSASATAAPPKQPTKTGFDHLDVNRLFKGKTAEPTTKLVAQKHGMQTLGKVLPARRAGGGPSLTSPPEGTGDSGEDRKPTHEQPTPSFQQDPNQGWTGQQPPPPQIHQQAPPHPNQIQPLLDQKWNGGRVEGNYPGSRFAQEFPSLDAAAGDGGKAQSTGPTHSHRPQTKSQDNQYGPGPILRPQTEGSWTLGGSGGKRPSPPNQQQNFPPDRQPMGPGGPIPGQMPMGPIPPPLGGYHPTFRPNQPPSTQYPKGSGFYPGAPNLRFGMPIPHDAPPPQGHSSGGEAPPPLRRTGPPPRPTSHFTSKPIIRQEELERMDEIGTHEGDWASTNDDVDYNKKINFSDEEEHSTKRTPPPQAGSQLKKAGQERQPQPARFMDQREEEERRQQHAARESDEEWRSRRGDKDREQRRSKDDDWRSGPSRSFSDDFRGKKGPVPSQMQPRDTRPGPQDFANANVPPRFLRRINQAQTQSGSGQRESPSPNTTNGGKEPGPHPPYKILERKRGESESSRDSKDSKDKRYVPPEPSSRAPDRDSKNEFRKPVPPPASSKLPETEKVEKKTMTSSWAEEMDEDESLNAISEMRKPHLKEVSPVLKKEERRDRIESKRIIKQTKVADMQTIVKEESPPKPSAVKKETQAKGSVPSQTDPSEGPSEGVKGKPISAWGDVEKSPPRLEEVQKTQEAQRPPAPLLEKVSEAKDVGGGPKGDILERREGLTSQEKEDMEDKRAKGPPQRKNSRESKHHQLSKDESASDSHKEDTKRSQHQQQPQQTQQKSQENSIQHKDQRGSAGSGDAKKEEKRAPAANKHAHKIQEGKHAPPKVEEGKGKGNMNEEVKRQGSAWNDKQQRRSSARQHHKDEDESKEGSVKSERKNEESEMRRGNKSPSSTKRNAPAHSHHGGEGRGKGGASRLQGYGPPSDRSPFSTNTNKEKEPEDERKDEKKKESHSTRLVIPPPTSGPIPLMALGEISPPDLPLRNRHNEYGRPPRFQRGFPPSQRPHKQPQSTNTKGGKGGRRDADSEQDPSSRWPKNQKQPHEEPSKGPGPGPESEQGKDPAQTPPAAPPSGPEPLADIGKVPTMVFENTKLKLSDSQQQQPKSLPPLLHSQQTLKGDERKSFSPGIGMGGEKGAGLDQNLDLSNQGPLPFPKEPSPVKLDFGTGFGEEREGKGNMFHQQSSRPYSHVHQEEFRRGQGISPLQTDLPESLQGLRSLWDTPPLSQEGNQDSSPLTFGQESEGLNYGREKQDQVPYHLAPMQRNMGNMGQPQGTNGFQSSQSSVSVIAKPVSSGSPTGLNRGHPQMKTMQQQQQMSLESQQQQQAHGPISFSPFGYGMPQGANAFGPIGGVPSPPSIYAQKSTQLYQQFNHHDNAHVLGGGRNHSQYGNYTNVGGGAGGNPYGSSLYLQPFESFGPYATHAGAPQQPPSLQLQSNNRISPGLPPTSASAHALPSPGMMNANTAPPGNNAFKAVQVRNPTSHTHPSLLHQNNQQPFSQLTHHLAHPHLTPIGPQKTPYSQQQLQPQSQPQLYIPNFEPNPQSLMGLGGNYVGLRSGGAPPPSGTPPMQGLSSSYYAAGTGVNQGYPQQNPQGGSIQGMQVPPPSNPHYGIQFQPQYNSQVQGPAPNVLGNSLARAQHGNRK